MRWRTTAVLAVLLVALGTFYYVYEIRQGPAREKATTEKDRVFKGLETKDVEEVVLKRGDERVHLRRAGESWQLLAPVDSRAEARSVDELLSAITATRLEREIEASPASLGPFGLEPPAVEITFKVKGQERGLRLGGKNPTGIWVYAQEAGKPAVFLTSDSLLRSAQRGASDFRDRTVLAFERKDVKAIEIERPAGAVVAVELKGPETWELTKPLGAPGDAREIGGLLDKLRAAKVKEFPPAPGRGPAEYGLDRPLRVTLWVGEDKERSAKTLRFGKAVPEKKAVYAQREGDTAVLLVEEELLKAVPTSPTGFRDKTVLTYDRSKLERFELESPKGKVAAALEGGAWRITAPEPLKGDEAVVNELLGKARDLRATDFVAEEATRLAAFSLDRPQVRLTLWEKDAKEPKTLRLGPAKAPGRAYATAGGPVVTVDGAALTQLARSVQDLRDRTVLPAFETRDVSRVEIRRGEVVLTMERKGESEWQLVAPKQGKVRPGSVDELVWSLRSLKWKTLVAESGWDAGRYGLGPPSTTVTLGGKDGKTLAALALGRREQEELFVRIPGQPALYTVESDGLGEVPTTAEEWLL